MTYTFPWMRLCDCRCPVHHGFQRTTYNEQGCACAITCVTQPLTLLIEPWNCALFLDHHDDVLAVPAMPGSQWDWANTAEIDEHHDFYDASQLIDQLLRTAALAVDRSIGIED